ncbi:putative disease resistance protein RGA3 [Oryza brachyantha]|uniref:putative disease resistance protein RGA3 n=1 Tax=Oryza brachyantha TaxID=4533 RepID=UPI001ADD17E9|nr:putative disease resistance protein RGA3 [Oryza brachyantha]
MESEGDIPSSCGNERFRKMATLVDSAAKERERENDKCLDPQLWHACAGDMVQMPPVNSKVYYFPQGHEEHAHAQGQGPVEFPAGRVPALVLCRVAGVRFMAEPDTDEVFAKIRLVPVRANEQGYPADADADDGIDAAAQEEKPASFAKMLTQSDAISGGMFSHFSVSRYCSKTIFRRLDCSTDPPSQTILAKDVHGVVWKFRHIYHDMPLCHRLTTGWSTFVKQKKLVAGDSVVFMRTKNGDLRVGIRRGKKGGVGGPKLLPPPLLPEIANYGGFPMFLRSDDDSNKMAAAAASGKVRARVRPEEVVEAANLAVSGQPFEVVYYPRASTPEFCVKAGPVIAAMRTQWLAGMRFKMAFESEDSSRISWFMGTVSAVQAADPVRWPNSPWRILKVSWDEPYLLWNVKRVSPWSVELVLNKPAIHLAPFSPSMKRPREPLYLDLSTIDDQFPTPMFGGNPIARGIGTPTGEQGAKHAQFGMCIPDIHLNMQSSLSTHREWRPDNTELTGEGTSGPAWNSIVQTKTYQYLPNVEQWMQDKPVMLQRALSRMHDLVNVAELWVHKDAVARLLQEAKDEVYSAENLLDELDYYELQSKVNQNTNPFRFPLHFEILMDWIHTNIDHLIGQMGNLGLQDMRHMSMDKSLHQKVDLFHEETIVGRGKDLMELLIRVLDFQGRSSTSDREQASCTSVLDLDQTRSENVCVLPIVGSGGVGKTTLVHQIFNEKRIQDHFDQQIWLCVSDGFDEKKLITRLLCSLADNELKSDDLSCLQRFLTNGIIHHSKRFLLVLDDMQEDVCKEEFNGWKGFLAPLECARPGSTILVTTRSLKVAEHLGTKKHFVLDGLPEESLWELFRMHAFGSDYTNRNQELEGIGRSIVARLNGSSLGAKILGRLLSLKLDGIYWKSILESELWDLPHQEVISSNPALLLSYQYMPSPLRHCFSFCSLYPKGYSLEAELLVNCWVAVGLVAPYGDMLAADIGHLYFQQLVDRSFLQRVTSSKYVMHGLLYDMAHQISSSECFVIKGSGDLSRIPPKVRHVSILNYSGLSSSDLESLQNYSTLRSVVCIGINSDALTASVLETWFNHLTNIRMLKFISCQPKEIPGNVGNLICLRYLDISSCELEVLPDSFWRLHKLEILDAQNCRFDCVPKEIVKLVNLRKVRLKGGLIDQLGCVPGVGKLIFLQEMPYYAVDDTPGRRIEELENMNHLRGALEISGLHHVTGKEQAAGASLDKKIHLDTLTLSWHDSIRPDKHNSNLEMEVLESLRPSPSIKNLEMRFYMGSGFNPSWFYMGSEFHPIWFLYGKEDEPISGRLESLSISSCPNIVSLFVTETSSSSSNGSSPVFRSLTKLCITWCRKLRSLDNLLDPLLLPKIRVIQISNCEELASLPTDQLGEFAHLEDLEVSHCWSLGWERGLTLPSSLKSLKLEACGEPMDPALSRGLRGLPAITTLELQFCSGLESIGAEVWSGLTSLRRLKIFCCQELSSIGGAESIARVEEVDIRHCPKLTELEQPFQRG